MHDTLNRGRFIMTGDENSNDWRDNRGAFVMTLRIRLIVNGHR
jgi:hypothetical protein